jgi:hypothetical protein
MSVDEIRTICEFLRANGIEVDPMRERQRKLAEGLVASFGPQLVPEPRITPGPPEITDEELSGLLPFRREALDDGI